MQSGQKLPLFQKAWLMLGLALSALLAGCGGAGSKYNEFIPKRIVVMGDEITYVGCTYVSSTLCTGVETYDRYTVNGTSSASPPVVNNWVVRLAALYGLPISQVVEPSTSVSASQRRTDRYGAKVSEITGQTSYIPSYASGDMLIIAGGANDILCVVVSDTSCNTSTTVLRNLDVATTVSAALRGITGAIGTDASLSDSQNRKIIAAAQAYQDLALSMLNRGQRNIFVAPVYDFSNSPDITRLCPSSCSNTQKQQFINKLQKAIYLFNLTLKNLTDSSGYSLTFNTGQPRILLATGSSPTDALYVNIPEFASVASSSVVGFNVTQSVCGSTHKSWTTDPTLHPETWDGVAGTVDYSKCWWNGAYDGTGTATNPDFISSSGKYMYTADQYLSPGALGGVANIFYVFMRGYFGW